MRFSAASLLFITIEYAALRPRETSAAATAAATAAVAAAAAASTSVSGLTDSLSALQAIGEMTIKSMKARKSSQDSGAVIPSDDEDGIGHRCSSHASSSNNSQRADKLAAAAESIPSTAAAAAATWRALNRPRMALAVLAVSLQHIAAHSDHLQYHQHRRQQQEVVARNQDHRDQKEEEEEEEGGQQPEQAQLGVPQLPPLPEPVDVRTSSVDEGIEQDR